jgi:hypothetical protein
LQNYHTTKLCAAAALLIVPLGLAWGQTGTAADSPEPAPATDITKQRVLGVLPNYRTADSQVPFVPLTSAQKFHIFYKDSTDWPVFPTALAYAGIYHFENQNPSFGQGARGFAHRFATAYADQVIGNFFSEAVIPVAFHHDPRYFRKGEGSVKGRMWYSVTRLVVCKTDRGGSAFNLSEIGGNAAQIGVAMSYYPDTRTWEDVGNRMMLQVGTDGVSNVMKEFWPDIRRKLKRHHAAHGGTGS